MDNVQAGPGDAPCSETAPMPSTAPSGALCTPGGGTHRRGQPSRGPRARSRRALRARSLALRFACPDVGVEGGGVRRRAGGGEGHRRPKGKSARLLRACLLCLLSPPALQCTPRAVSPPTPCACAQPAPLPGPPPPPLARAAASLPHLQAAAG
eukprot:scaffold95812_cov69-Phaeocystis_antarctica.AAC.2